MDMQETTDIKTWNIISDPVNESANIQSKFEKATYPEDSTEDVHIRKQRYI